MDRAASERHLQPRTYAAADDRQGRTPDPFHASPTVHFEHAAGRTAIASDKWAQSGDRVVVDFVAVVSGGHVFARENMRVDEH